MTHDPDTLCAYVDGELDEVTAARLAKAAEVDPELAARIAAETRLRDILIAHFDPVLAEQVPQRLVLPIETSRKVVSLQDQRSRLSLVPPRMLRWTIPAMAAALALTVFLPGSGGPTETRDGLIFAANDLAEALDTQLVADQEAGNDTRILLSFADKEGRLCRAFARTDVSGIACMEYTGWHLRTQQGGVDIKSGDYRQASSVDSSIMASAQEMADGPAFDAEQERLARAQSWRPR